MEAKYCWGKSLVQSCKKNSCCKKSQNIEKQLIMPCCQVIVSNVFGDSIQKLKQVSFSNGTVSRTAKLSGDILSQVVSKIQKSMFGFFSIQLDETTNVAK